MTGHGSGRRAAIWWLALPWVLGVAACGNAPAALGPERPVEAVGNFNFQATLQESPGASRSAASIPDAGVQARPDAGPVPVVFHVKTALSVDDAQICVVPNVAWAVLDGGDEVVLLFDGSAVTSITRGFGWRGWLGIRSTAMDRAPLPERERRSLADQFGVPLDTVPSDYGEYLRFLKERGARLYYNRTMALLYDIDPERVDTAVQPLQLKEMARLLSSARTYLVY